MFKATVAQNATTPVSDGMKNVKNSPKVWNFDGAESIGPRPPAFEYAHQSIAKPRINSAGAEIPCRKRIVLIPRRITIAFNAQNKKKQSQTWFQPGMTAASNVLIASPPIQV